MVPNDLGFNDLEDIGDDMSVGDFVSSQEGVDVSVDGGSGHASG